MNRKLIVICVIGMSAWLAGCAFSRPVMATKAPGPKISDTFENLQYAYSEESNLVARYEAYAKKADEEGYGSIASLFRAVARSEKVHADNHAVEIKKLNGEPKIFPVEVDVKSTWNNLREASRSEAKHQKSLYSDFIGQAREEDVREPILTFTFARNAENQHAKLFRSALANFGSWNASKHVFYVCPVCGYVSGSRPEKCPNCNMAGYEYIKVN